MSKMRARSWAPLFAVAGVVAAAACKSGAPSKDEMDRLIDERLAERGLASLPSAPGSSAASASAAPSASSAGTPASDPAAASLAFLAKLDALMKDYSPPLPVGDDKSDMLRCITSDASKNSLDLQKVAATLRKRADAAKQERKRHEAEFYGSSYSLAFHYDLDWQTRKGAAVAETYGCWCDQWSDESTPEGCKRYGFGHICTMPGVWKLRSSGRPAAYVYSSSPDAPTRPPELMRRMDAAAIKPPARFSCRVDDVLPGQGQRTIKCSSSGVPASLRVSGDLGPVNVGDLVSVPVASTRRDPDGVLFKNVGGTPKGWVIDADAASLTVDSAATCPSMAEILTSLETPGAR
jgi:hypothetical protein